MYVAVNENIYDQQHPLNSRDKHIQNVVDLNMFQKM